MNFARLAAQALWTAVLVWWLCMLLVFASSCGMHAYTTCSNGVQIEGDVNCEQVTAALDACAQALLTTPLAHQMHVPAIVDVDASVGPSFNHKYAGTSNVRLDAVVLAMWDPALLCHEVIHLSECHGSMHVCGNSQHLEWEVKGFFAAINVVQGEM